MKKYFISIIVFVIIFVPLAGKKKINFELFLGISIPNYDSLYISDRGIDNYLKNYSEYLNLPMSETGSYSQINISIPVSLTIKYPIKNKFSLRGSIEYNSGNASGEKTYSVKWPDFNEEYKLSNGYKIVNLTAMLGLEYKISDFALYLDTGINMGNISHTTEVVSYDSGITYSNKNIFKGSGTGFALSIGAKYKKKLRKIGNLVLKIELFLSAINSLPGTMNSTWVNPIEGDGSGLAEGRFYVFEVNPYGSDWFEDMGFFQIAPNSGSFRNLKELAISFSSIKIGIGYSF